MTNSVCFLSEIRKRADYIPVMISISFFLAAFLHSAKKYENLIKLSEKNKDF